MNPISSPHAHGARSVGRVMLLVMLALTPATLAGFWHFGWPAITLWCVTILSALISEAFCARLAERPAGPLLADGSAMLTGWLLALSLPPGHRGGSPRRARASPSSWPSTPSVAWDKTSSTRQWPRG